MNKEIISKKILIVDDDQDLIRGLSIRLRANGYNVFTASDAISAVSTCGKTEPDLIILDIGLPGGDGFLVMDRLKNISSINFMPIIILSARDPLLNKQRALDAGAYTFFQKPADNDELLTAIQDALEGNRPAVVYEIPMED